MYVSFFLNGEGAELRYETIFVRVCLALGLFFINLAGSQLSSSNHIKYSYDTFVNVKQQ